MTFDRHRMVGGPSAVGRAAYHLTASQSLVWHDRDGDGSKVRAEIRSAASGRPIYDFDGRLLERATPSPAEPRR